MNGSITVKSEYGRGSAFTVEFYQDQAGNSVIGDTTVNNLTQFRYSTQRRSQNQQIIRIDMSYAKVLIVDDVPTNLEVARAMLKPYGIAADCVKSGDEAIRLVREENPRYNAIFMDHMMPGMDGIEAARIIRNEINSAYAKTVPIIALTANALLGNDTMFLENGFQAFLAKPIDILRLDNILNIWVRDKEQEKKLKKISEQAAEQTQSLKLLGNDVIPGLNIAEGLARLGNDEESYVQILKSYITHIPEFAETVRQEAAGDLQKYRIAVHGIKGSSNGIGAKDLGAKAEELENAAKQGDTTFIQNNTGPFLVSVENFITILEGFIQALDAQAGSGKAATDVSAESSAQAQ
jgi:CheY-like chemotaxis protein